MNSFYDFLTHVKGVEYIISILCIAGYVLYAEVLKPKPFKTLVETGREDMEFIRQDGYKNTKSAVGKIVAAPFIGLTFVIALPFVFAYAVLSSAVNGVLHLAGKEAGFGWRPLEAYLEGKKRSKDGAKTDQGE
jgi:hypothetical protein